MRADIERDTKSKPYETKRIRIVEEPLTPYLWWEMHILKMRSEAGDQAVVLRKNDVAQWEVSTPLPEIVGLGDSILWVVHYDDEGVYESATRVNDPTIVQSSREQFLGLFAGGEELQHFCASKVDPPVVS